MTERAFFRTQAVAMARRQADYLLSTTAQLQAPYDVPQAVALIRDCVQYLDLPALAIEVALGFHPHVERWAAWSTWPPALDLVLAIDQPHDPSTTRVRLLNCRSQAARALGDAATAVQAADQALQQAQAAGDRALVAEAHNRLGAVAFLRDDLIAAVTHFEQAAAYGRASLPALEYGHISMNRGTLAMQQNQFDVAHHCFDEASHHYAHANNPVALAKLQCNCAELLRREGRPEDALAILRAAVEVLRRHGARYDYGLALNDLGCVYLSLQQWELALDAFHAAVEECDHINSLSGKAWVLPNIAELYVTTQRWAEAEQAIDSAQALALACSRPLIAAAVDVDRGRMLAARGNADGARQAWEAAHRVQATKGALLAAQATQALLDGLTTGTSQPSR